MGELIDKAKGKVKEVTGRASGDRSLEAEGQADQTKGKVKEAFEHAKERVREALHREPGYQAPKKY